MKYSFKSSFAQQIKDFIEQKRALGFTYNGGEQYLYRFDKHCLEFFPDEEKLTKEIALSWAVNHGSEVSSSFRNRIGAMREFAKYLNGIGITAHIISNKYGKNPVQLVPYIYSENEIAAIWNELDQIEPIHMSTLRHMVIPAFVRLLYCCGLRPCEASRLTVNDVDLNSGKIYIRESKGHKDRLIKLADDVKDYCLNYNTNISKYLPKRIFFFPQTDNKPFPLDSIRKQFIIVKEKLGITKVGTISPRLYDFRHTFATHRLYKWLSEGKDLNLMMPYLSAYMGHAKLSATYYYIHLVPGQLEALSGLDFSRYEEMLPEVEADE